MARRYRLGVARRLANRGLALVTRIGVVPGLYLLTTRGRKTGLQRSTPVQLVGLGGARWLVAPYGIVGWVQNARASGRVTLSKGGRSTEHAVVEASPEEAAPVLRRYLRVYPVVRPFFDAGFTEPLERFVAEAPRHPVFRIED